MNNKVLKQGYAGISEDGKGINVIPAIYTYKYTLTEDINKIAISNSKAEVQSWIREYNKTHKNKVKISVCQVSIVEEVVRKIKIISQK